MSYGDEWNAWREFITGLYLDWPIDWPNSPGGEPERPYLKIRVIPAGVADTTLQHDLIERPGVLDVAIVCDLGTGVGTADTIADRLVADLTNATIAEHLRTRVAFKTVIGENQGRYLVNVTAPFSRETYS